MAFGEGGKDVLVPLSDVLGAMARYSSLRPPFILRHFFGLMVVRQCDTVTARYTKRMRYRTAEQYAVHSQSGIGMARRPKHEPQRGAGRVGRSGPHTIDRCTALDTRYIGVNREGRPSVKGNLASVKMTSERQQKVKGQGNFDVTLWGKQPGT